MTNFFVLRSFNDKHAYPIRIIRDFNQWRRRKCWHVHCNNEINVVHVSEWGNATHGYCWWCYRDCIVWDIFWGGFGYKRGKWVTCEKHYKTKKSYLKEDKSSKSLLESFNSRFKKK